LSRLNFELQFRRFVRLQWAPALLGPCFPELAYAQNRHHIEPHVKRAKPAKAGGGQIQKPAPGREPPHMDGVLRKKRLFIKVHKRTGQLDESLVEAPVLIETR
jgi:hypothetical protein